MAKKILIVDDEADVLLLLGQRLSTAGYEVFSANNGRNAILLAKKVLPDLIILDVMMPDMDGGAVANVLKDDLKTINIPIIFLTCLVTKGEEASKTASMGAAYLAKPYSAEDLLNAVRKHLGEK